MVRPMQARRWEYREIVGSGTVQQVGGRGIAVGVDLDRTTLGLPGAGELRLPLVIGRAGATRESFKACFRRLRDPRRGNAGRYDLLEMLMIAACTVLCSANDCIDMAEFAQIKLEFLRGAIATV